MLPEVSKGGPREVEKGSLPRSQDNQPSSGLSSPTPTVASKTSEGPHQDHPGESFDAQAIYEVDPQIEDTNADAVTTLEADECPLEKLRLMLAPSDYDRRSPGGQGSASLLAVSPASAMSTGKDEDTFSMSESDATSNVRGSPVPRFFRLTSSQAGSLRFFIDFDDGTPGAAHKTV